MREISTFTVPNKKGACTYPMIAFPPASRAFTPIRRWSSPAHEEYNTWQEDPVYEFEMT